MKSKSHLIFHQFISQMCLHLIYCELRRSFMIRDHTSAISNSSYVANGLDGLDRECIETSQITNAVRLLY